MPANSRSQGQGQVSPGLRTAALISALIGGGIVGLDYAKWFDAPPMIGAVIGSAISAILTGWLLHLQNDPDGKIREACIAIGGIGGGILGIVVGLQNFGGAGGLFGGAIGGAIIGGIAGQIIAGLISLAAFALLFLSRGPIGLFLRNVILKQEEDYGSIFGPVPETYDRMAHFADWLGGFNQWIA